MREHVRRPNQRLSRLIAPFNVETRAIDTVAGTFSGWASTYGDTDSYGTAIAPGAFDESLAEHARNGAMPAMLWQHDWFEVCGRWLKLESRAEGLWAEGAWELNTQRGREGNALIAANPLPALNGLSIGFEPDWEATEWRGDVLLFKRVKLWEISVVTFPANAGARIENVRAPDGVQTERDLEHTLRDAGYSRSEAARIASRFKPIDRQRDAGATETDYRGALDALASIFPRT